MRSQHGWSCGVLLCVLLVCSDNAIVESSGVEAVGGRNTPVEINPRSSCQFKEREGCGIDQNAIPSKSFTFLLYSSYYASHTSLSHHTPTHHALLRTLASLAALPARRQPRAPARMHTHVPARARAGSAGSMQRTHACTSMLYRPATPHQPPVLRTVPRSSSGSLPAGAAAAGTCAAAASDNTAHLLSQHRVLMETKGFTHDQASLILQVAQHRTAAATTGGAANPGGLSEQHAWLRPCRAVPCP